MLNPTADRRTHTLRDTTRPKPTILIFIGTYLPGFKAGGALRTVSNIVTAFSHEFSFWIVTTDRDSGDQVPYPSVTVGSWQPVVGSQVMYVSRAALTVTLCAKLLKDINPDAVYLQSCFSLFTLKPLIAVRFFSARRFPVIVAPRGEFYPGALSIRRLKKHLYIAVSRMAGLYSQIIWQASSAEEADAVTKWYGDRARVIVAPDLAEKAREFTVVPRQKIEGRLKVIFLSRICPKKNLAGALSLLKSVSGSVSFDIFGPAEDAEYWKECQSAIADLPAGIKVQYKGVVPHEQVSQIFAGYDLFLFPTLGENFGHVILESLLSGCPVLISDQTPWRSLISASAGWDLPLTLPMQFSKALQDCVNMDEDAYSVLRAGARRLGLSYTANGGPLQATRELFAEAVNGR